MQRPVTVSWHKMPGAKLTEMPAGIELQLATLRKNPPSGDNWIHEIKFDGYRMLCRIEGGKIGLITRGQLDWANGELRSANLLHARDGGRCIGCGQNWLPA
jgi:bifunctional non-homologous end joining protein LigD